MKLWAELLAAIIVDVVSLLFMVFAALYMLNLCLPAAWRFFP